MKGRSTRRGIEPNMSIHQGKKKAPRSNTNGVHAKPVRRRSARNK